MNKMFLRIILNGYISETLYLKRFKMAREGYFVHYHSTGVRVEHDYLQISNLNCKTFFQMLVTLGSLTVYN